jgi:hypothetical protein
MNTRTLLLLSTTLLYCFALSACEDGGDDDDDTGYQLPDSPPEAYDDQAEAYSAVLTSIAVLDNDFDAEDDSLDVDSVTQPNHGSTDISGSRKRVEYTSEPGFIGSDSFNYSAIDDEGNTATATVSVEVTATPVVEILSPAEAEIVTTSPVPVSWQVDGCEVSAPGNNPGGCHLHRYVDRVLYSDANSGPEWFGRVDFEVLDLEPGLHRLELRLHRNDGSDASWDPEVTHTVDFCLQTCDDPK